MKKIYLLVSLLFLSFSAVEAENSSLKAHLELKIDRYIINHRFGLHALTLELEMDGEEPVCQDTISAEVKTFLLTYLNQDDFWEIVNKKLVFFLAKLHSGQQHIRSTLSIEPDLAKPFARRSIFEQVDGAVKKQSFSFDSINQPLNDNLVNFTVEMEYSPEAQPADYVNFFAVKDKLDLFIKDNLASNFPSSLLPEKIAKYLLTCFPSVKGFGVILDIPSHAGNPIKCSWKSALFREETESTKS